MEEESYTTKMEEPMKENITKTRSMAGESILGIPERNTRALG